MGPLEELKLHADALSTAVDASPKFFASVKHYVAQLKQLLRGQRVPSRTELDLLVSKIEEFWAQWRPTGGGDLYIPPRETSDTDSTVQRMQTLVRQLTNVDESAFQEMAKKALEVFAPPERGARQTVSRPCVFIGHGRSRLWARVKTYLEDELGLATVTYESEPRTGEAIVPVLERMLDQASFAVLLFTAEDATPSGPKRARQNVIHEAGLFQGKLGFKRAVLLVQEGIEEFSNVAGLQHIPFSGESVEQTFYELQRVLKRENQVDR